MGCWGKAVGRAATCASRTPPPRLVFSNQGFADDVAELARSVRLRLAHGLTKKQLEF